MQEMNSTISTSWFYLSQKKTTTEEIIASFWSFMQEIPAFLFPPNVFEI